VLDDTGVDTVVARTDGVTAAFLKGLLREAALLAASADAASDADGSGPIRVTDTSLEAALDQLLGARSQLTRVLLGGQAHATAGQAAAG
jgi:hypothetical protein